jgi:hypothetical protein
MVADMRQARRKQTFEEAAYDKGFRDGRAELLGALMALVEAGEYVSPIVGAVATEATVKDIRRAGNFVEATDRARAAIAKAKGKP